ncbi:MAG: TonB-dependent receptor [Acidobacteriota bacterium]|jgi:iron complex outermembrane receptor protein|nr:TonB-dependent receptor [Acidobacteriota bacterium]
MVQSKKSCFFLSFILSMSIIGTAASPAEKKNATEQKQKPIIEEVVVTGKAPAQQPISRVSRIPRATIEALTPAHMGEVINFTTGVYATDGNKNESRLMIRGLASSRITLMLDGIPVYEPYFNSFDLKTISAANVDSVKVIKGASSVLYGANTLGGVLNVVTRRPDQPYLSLNSSFGDNQTLLLNASGGAAFKRFAVQVDAVMDRSDGYDIRQDGERVLRQNSDHERVNLNGKAYFSLAENSEIMAQVMFNQSEFGLPAATEYLKARIWRFTDWQRLQLNLGGTFPLLQRGVLKIRTYYVRHFNVLDQYGDYDFSQRQWESTYMNHSLGAIVSGEYPLFERHDLKFNLTYNDNIVRQQGDIGDPWEEYNRGVLSVGVEDHIRLNQKWTVVAGVSLDALYKDSGENESRFNPIVGLRFMPREWLAIHAAFAHKSRFPAMKSLYGSSGNPDLRSEYGNSLEAGITFERKWRIEAAVFLHRIQDMIQSYRGLDGYRTDMNVGRAELAGIEAAVSRRFRKVEFSLNYTWMHSEDRDTGLPLDYIPASQFNTLVTVGPFSGFSLTVWALAASSSQASLGKAPPFQVIDIPGYATVNLRLEKRFKGFMLYLIGENLFDADYFTEPGFPMRARGVRFGAQVDLRKYK